jgi:hypothetical protein
MTIKKIQNVKYSPSKNKEEAKWAEALAKRNRLLLESDWKQLPDVNLTRDTKNRWANWRKNLRHLKRIDFETLEEFQKALTSLETERYNIYTEFSDTSGIKDLVSGKAKLHQLLVSFYKEKVNYKFSPNLEEKYQEVLDLISIILTEEPDASLDSFSMEKLIEYIESKNNHFIEKLIDPAYYPFFELTKNIKNATVKDTILYILKQKKEQYDFALKEEYMFIHLEHRIESCANIRDVLLARDEIEMYYGH